MSKSDGSEQLARRLLEVAGTTYADEIPGGSAFETQQQLVSVQGSRVRLLWQQGSTAPK